MSRKRAPLVLSFVYLLSLSTIPVHASPPTPKHIRDVAVSPAFFNPTVSQYAAIRFHAAIEGTATVSILDRDRFPIRVLEPRHVTPGLHSFDWDGRDAAGTVVPDEAYNVRIELRGARAADVYDPSLDFHSVSDDPQPRTYTRTSGVLTYRLNKPARVHIEAGQATVNPATGRATGPIMRTIVNREPRVAGAVIEKWNGFDESGTIRVSELPNFVVSVLATSLPESSIITRGNRRESFLDYAKRKRKPSDLVPRKVAPTHHHAGLNAFEDRSPELQVKPSATWNAAGRAYTVDGPLKLEIGVTGASAAHFLAQPARMSVYVDERKVLSKDKPVSPLVLEIPAADLTPGEHRIVVNWGSDYGPAALQSFRINVAAKRAEAKP
ncbi:MAG TPA: hypothetical protein VF618_09435 [Thermoanaerobaculia bacterium]